MDWGLISTILAVVFFVSTVILTIRLTRREMPVWAYKTVKIIGRGANAPLELKLFFNNREIQDVYRTTLILFNRGNETLRREDVTDKIRFRFQNAQILREPRIIIVNKSEIRFSTKQIEIAEKSLSEQ